MINAVIDMMETGDAFRIGFLKGAPCALVPGAIMLGILYTIGAMMEIQAFRMRLTGKKTGVVFMIIGLVPGGGTIATERLIRQIPGKLAAVLYSIAVILLIVGMAVKKNAGIRDAFGNQKKNLKSRL